MSSERESPPASTRLPVIDCSDRHAACGARCCSLDVPITPEEAASGRYQTEACRPRRLARADSGLCVYWRPTALACSIHAERPAACRAYRCDDDTRIWRDFEARRVNAKALHALVHRGAMPPRDD